MARVSAPDVTQALEQLQSAVLGLKLALAARETEPSPGVPAAAPALPSLYTPDEAAAWLKCERTKVYAMVHRGELAAIHVGTHLRLTQTELQRWLDARLDSDSPQQAAPPLTLHPAPTVQSSDPVKLRPRPRKRLGGVAR